MKDVKDIVSEYLKENGFDGLYNPEGECGCLMEEGLQPCCENFAECKPGYKVKREDLSDENKKLFGSEYDYVVMGHKP